MADNKVTYSRHARGRMKLYDISEEDVEEVLAKPDIGPETEEDRFIAVRKLKGKFKEMPLKVVYVIEESKIVVISAYPLKKSYKR